MKRHFIILGCILSLTFCTAFLSGCECMRSKPNQAKAVQAVVDAVDIAMRGWADYVIAERKRASVAAEPQQSQIREQLVRKEVIVAYAFERYQKTVAAVKTLKIDDGSVLSASGELLAAIHSQK